MKRLLWATAFLLLQMARPGWAQDSYGRVDGVLSVTHLPHERWQMRLEEIDRELACNALTERLRQSLSRERDVLNDLMRGQAGRRLIVPAPPRGSSTPNQ